MLSEKWVALGRWGPLGALKRVGETKWLIDGVIPSGSINWMVAAPGSFKTFLALDMAAAVACGRPWHGRETDEAVVLYLAAEGGNDIHVRRAAVDLAAGDVGPMCIAQLRPRLDEEAGLASLLAIIYDLTYGGLSFPEAQTYWEESMEKYLTPKERAEFNALECGDEDQLREVFGYVPNQVGDDAARKFSLELSRPRFSAWDEAFAVMQEDNNFQPAKEFKETLRNKVLLVIDTYSQTSADDAKGTVSRYIKTLRDLQDKATALGGAITVLVVDHTTKSGDSYMGSLAKEGDSDTMMDVDRHGDGYSVTVRCAKMKCATPFAPIHLDMKPVTLDGFTDVQGRPLTSLVVADGEQAHKIRKVAGADKDTAAAVLLAVLTSVGPCLKDQLRLHYGAHATNAGKNPATVSRSFLRGLQNLITEGVVSELPDGTLAPVEGDSRV